MNDSIEAKIAKIGQSGPPVLDQIPFSLLERQHKKTTKLLANSGATATIEGQHRQYKYTFEEPVFISHVSIELSGYKSFDHFKWRYTTFDGKELTATSYPEGDEITVNIDDLCTEVSFEPPRAWLRQPRLNSIKIYGFPRSSASDFINFAYDIDSIQEQAVNEIRVIQGEAQKTIDEAKEKENTLVSLNQKAVEANGKLENIQAQIIDAADKLNEITAKSGATAKQLEATEERIANLRSEIKVQTQKKEQLQRESTSLESTLKTLKEDINLFPSEISGYVDQASKNTDLYLRYSFGPLFILCSMFILLIIGAADLTTIVTKSPDVNLAAIIVSRMPYVAVASAIIYASYRLARLFIAEVMNINRQRLSLTQISIIAKDISQSAESDLGFNGDQIYANRLKVKMALLGDHIKHLISTEPELLFPENLFFLPRSGGRTARARKPQSKTARAATARAASLK